jgi:glycosyltransferase involved in cell wall biosynthesis
VVTNGVDADLFTPRPADSALRERLGLKPDAFVVTFAGTIGMASGLELALGAARRLKEQGRDDVAFLLVGDGAVRADLERQARTQGLDNVVFAGLVPRAELPDYLASSDACLVHFRKQALFSTILPSKFFEDAAMQKPILLGFEGDARAMLRDADCGIAFEPGNDAELAAAVVKLADDRAECARLGANGRRYVLEHFERRTLAHDYLEILERVRAGYGRGPR